MPVTGLAAMQKRMARERARNPRDPRLARLRLKLAGWYVGIVGVTLGVLGTLLFALLVRGMSNELDATLEDATQEVVHAASLRSNEGASDLAAATEAVDELQNTRRPIYL